MCYICIIYVLCIDIYVYNTCIIHALYTYYISIICIIYTKHFVQVNVYIYLYAQIHTHIYMYNYIYMYILCTYAV